MSLLLRERKPPSKLAALSRTLRDDEACLRLNEMCVSGSGDEERDEGSGVEEPLARGVGGWRGSASVRKDRATGVDIGATPARPSARRRGGETGAGAGRRVGQQASGAGGREVTRCRRQESSATSQASRIEREWRSEDDNRETERSRRLRRAHKAKQGV